MVMGSSVDLISNVPFMFKTVTQRVYDYYVTKLYNYISENLKPLRFITIFKSS